MKIAVIGTAGRKGSHRQLDSRIVDRMVETVLSHCDENTTIVTGGAAWADHAGVLAALKNSLSLELYLPDYWDSEKKKFHDTGENNWQRNPGGTANHFHVLQMRQTGKRSLSELDEAIQRDATKTEVHFGFFARNLKVAENADMVIAFTFGEGDEPADGGTKHTWTAAKNMGKNCVHYCIDKL